MEHTSVHLSVSWYQHLNCLSDFHEIYRVLYKEFCCEHVFCINQLTDSRHLRIWMNYCLCLPYSLTHLGEMWYSSYTSIKQLWVSWKLTQHKPYFTCGCKWIYIHPFKICCMLWVKYSIMVLHVIWLNICEVWENQYREGCALHMAVNEILFVCNLQLCGFHLCV